MATVTGVVEAMSNKFDKTSILVNGSWYGSKYGFKCNKGDTVEFDDMGKKMVKGLRVVGDSSGGSVKAYKSSPSAPGFPVGTTTKDRAIVRQNSLGHAVALVTALMDGVTIGDWDERETQTEAFAALAVNVARIFEAYSSGDADYEEVKKMLEDEE